MAKKVRLWTLGSLEHKILPTVEGIAKLREILKQNNDGEYFDLVRGPELSVKEIEVSDNCTREEILELGRLDALFPKKINYTLPITNHTESVMYYGESKVWPQKVAIIFGITGMDGSHLADLLLEKRYKVVGVKRRSSTNNEWRVKHLAENANFSMVSGDLTDYGSLVKVFSDIGHVDEVYNLAAQSHVGESFKQPGVTWDITGKGCMNILQCLADLKMTDTKFYQASSSEMFGASYDTKLEDRGGGPGVYVSQPYGRIPQAAREVMGYDEGMTKKYQNENTKQLPQSPYAIAKCAAHMAVRLYREAYGIHASAGILFNHETLTYNTPLIYRTDDQIDILPIGDIATLKCGVNFDLTKLQYQSGVPTNIEVWDQTGWTKVKYVSGYPHTEKKNPRIINSRNSVYAATGSHICIMEDGSEKETCNLNTKDCVKLINFPKNKEVFMIDKVLEYCEFLGMLVGDGNVTNSKIRFTNKDSKLKERFFRLWSTFTLNPKMRLSSSISGFTGEEVGQISVTCDKIDDILKYIIYNDIYTKEVTPFGHYTKKVPKCILNGTSEMKDAFLVGYNTCDGLKSNSCIYEFKNFKTNSHTLACGLIYLISGVTQQKYNITVEESWKWGKQQFYYSINLLSDKQSNIEKYNTIKIKLAEGLSQRQICRDTGISRVFIRKVQNGYIPNNTHHLELPNNEIKKIIEIPEYKGWFFDLETESGTFHCGAGQGVVHNSPRRGENFVTKKITLWIADFDKWLQEQQCDEIELNFTEDQIIAPNCRRISKLRLGNLEAKRDWGHAKDYVRAMHLMLQQETPDDYVICTEETRSVKDFLDVAFGHINIVDWNNYVVIDPAFYRPAEVDFLLGDCTKAREKLNWQREYSFHDLVKEMVTYDIDRANEKV